MDKEHYLEMKELGAKFIGIGGDVQVMTYGMRELARTFADTVPDNSANAVV